MIKSSFSPNYHILESYIDCELLIEITLIIFNFFFYCSLLTLFFKFVFDILSTEAITMHTFSLIILHLIGPDLFLLLFIFSFIQFWYTFSADSCLLMILENVNFAFILRLFGLCCSNIRKIVFLMLASYWIYHHIFFSQIIILYSESFDSYFFYSNLKVRLMKSSFLIYLFYYFIWQILFFWILLSNLRFTFFVDCLKSINLSDLNIHNWL